jgi:hypothetical protein
MRSVLPGFLLALLVLVTGAAPAPAEDNPAVVETLEILRERGMIDDAKYAELVAKNQAWEAARPSLLSRLEWTADFRGRLENFWYEENPFPGEDETPDRTRGRYRLRIGARAKVNEVATAGFMLGSGDLDGSGGENRSTNRSFGTGPDFDMDTIFIDQAYMELSVPQRYLAEGMTLKSITGKQANPFLWKNGKDIMIWDNDITPEGVALQWTALPAERLSLFANAGYFISDENSSERDPHVLGFQGGLGFAPVADVDMGLRGSVYRWGSDTSTFQESADEFGAVSNFDVAGDPIPIDYNVVEVGAYTRFKQIEGWPILFYGQFAQNVDADSIPGAGDQDLGWGAGVEVGDKKRLVMLGAGYYHLEANFSPAQFVDSDLFDGYTNRKGFMVYAARELFSNTELNVTFFRGDVIEDGAAFDIEEVTGVSTPSPDRYRLQTDVIVKF